MKLITVQLPDNHNIFHFGDKHEGSVLSYQKGWDIMVNLMKSKYDGCSNNYGIDGGDQIEAIMVDDKRFSEENLTEARPLAQVKKAIKDHEPIKDQLLVMLDGNHTRKLWKFGNLVEDMCEQLGVPYGTYTCKITVEDKKGNPLYKIYETHGFKYVSRYVFSYVQSLISG